MKNSMRNQLIFWLFAFLFAATFLYVFRAILMPFVAGLILAYFFDPLADRIEKAGLARWLGAIVCLMVLFCIFALAIIIIVPIAVQQFSALIENLPMFIERLQNLIGEHVPLNNLGENLPTPIIEQTAKWGGAILGSLWNSTAAFLSVLSLFIITPIVTFYLLVDWNRMIKIIDESLPRQQAKTIRMLCKDIDSAIGAFVRGQISVCLLLGLFYAISLSLFGLNFGLLIGLFAGIISFIPFVGSLIGLLVALLIAILQYGSEYINILIVIFIFLFGQFVEGNILQPRIVGRSVGLHPVWLMFSLAAFGSLFGFTGLLVAVPLSAALAVLVRFALFNYKKSLFYGKRKK